MQRGRDPFSGFGDPFGSGFGDPFGSGFGDPFGGLGVFGGQSLMSSVFGGRGPFDDPFFTHPFGSSFGSSFFGSAGGPFMNVSTGGPVLNANTSGFLEHQPSLSNKSRGLVIEELKSEDETVENEGRKDNKVNPRKHSRSSKEPIVDDPDDEAADKKSKYMCCNDLNLIHHERPHPQIQSFTFHSSSVTYGGTNGAYYTSSRTRTGSDGLALEECKEANSNTGQATHRISRGLHEKGHSFTRKLNSDGRVDTMQTLHNLNEDELVGFEEAWVGNARKQLPGWSEGLSSHNVMAPGGSNQLSQTRGGSALQTMGGSAFQTMGGPLQTRGGSAYPSTERSNGIISLRTDSGRGTGGFPSRQLGRKKTDITDGTGSSHFRANGTNHVKRS